MNDPSQPLDTASEPAGHAPTRQGLSLALLPFFLLFLGDLTVPIGDGTVVVPSAMAIVIPMVVFNLMRGRLVFPLATILLMSTIFFAVIGTALSPLASVPRSLVGMLPLIYPLLVVLAYGDWSISADDAVRYMSAGGVVLAIAVIFLFLASLGVQQDFYEQKLAIETPLGRSNYLAAFFVFLAGLSLSKSRILVALFAVSIFCTLSRGGVLALALLIFLNGLPRQGIARWMALMFMGTVVVVASPWMYELLMSYSAQLATAGPGDSVANRLELWRFGAEIIADNPLFGVGPGTFRTYVETTFGVEDVAGVHNSLLFCLMSYGIVGTSFYFAYLLAVYRAIRRAELVDPAMFHLRMTYIVLLIFALYEPLVGSAAFEVLLSMILVVSCAKQTKARRLAVNS